MGDSGSAQDNAARDVDEIRGRNEVTKDPENNRHGFSRENVSAEEDARKNGKKSELHCFELAVCFARNEDSQRQADKQIRKREEREQQRVSVNRDAENKTHEANDQAKLKEADGEVGKQLAEEQAHGAHWRDEELLEGATFFFTDDGKSS